MKKFTFIQNPTAGGARATRINGLLRRSIDENRLNAEIVSSEHQGHATELAEQSRADVIVAVGGDGTINEVANGLIGSSKLMGILPAGSGNDLVKSLGIPNQWDDAFRILIALNSRSIDVGMVSCLRNDNLGVDTRYFLNGVGIGFDAEVAERSKHNRFLRGTALYVISVMQTLGKYRSPDFTIRLNGEVRTSRNLLIAIGNGRCAGGGFYLTPDAIVDDGLLDVCLVGELSVRGILQLMPHVMKGKHGLRKEVSFQRTNDISVSGSKPFFVHADGEIVGRHTREVKVVLKEKLLGVIAQNHESLEQ